MGAFGLRALASEPLGGSTDEADRGTMFTPTGGGLSERTLIGHQRQSTSVPRPSHCAGGVIRL